MRNIIFLLIVPIFLTISVMGVDLSKIHPTKIVGGSMQRTTPTSTTMSKPDRERHVPYKYKQQRGAPLVQMYRGSSHEKALDAQIAAYKPKALKNLLTYGGYTKRWLDENDLKKMVKDISEPRNLVEEFMKLEKQGDIKVRFKDGLTYINIYK